MSKPFFMVTDNVAKWSYQQGYLTAPGYLFQLLASLKKPGYNIDIPNVSEFYQLAGIAKATFYEAKQRLVDDGVMIQEWINDKLRLKLIPGSIVRDPGPVVQDPGLEPPETPPPQASQPPPRSSTDLLNKRECDQGQPVGENSAAPGRDQECPPPLESPVEQQEATGWAAMGRLAKKFKGIVKRPIESTDNPVFSLWWDEMRRFRESIGKDPGRKKTARYEFEAAIKDGFCAAEILEKSKLFCQNSIKDKNGIPYGFMNPDKFLRERQFLQAKPARPEQIKRKPIYREGIGANGEVVKLTFF